MEQVLLQVSLVVPLESSFQGRGGQRSNPGASQDSMQYFQMDHNWKRTLLTLWHPCVTYRVHIQATTQFEVYQWRVNSGIVSDQKYSVLLTKRSFCCGSLSEIALNAEYVTSATLLWHIPETHHFHPKATPRPCSEMHYWDYSTVSKLSIYWKIIQRWEWMHQAIEIDTLIEPSTSIVCSPYHRNMNKINYNQDYFCYCCSLDSKYFIFWP